ncbi:DUF5691 domain-containing protein [Streptacidiphilus carbonis]|uniref:DUF5691 domain-containing protein n=1 Tax=Streptacidiphilus carbonis TaxID=105422 RepID=UPI000A6B5DB6|nr:DUF5691 domain-containing protein [Streptacidiphilus carbonis]
MSTAPYEGAEHEGAEHEVVEHEVVDTDWPELVTTALLGTDRRPLPVAPDADPAIALLDRAALHTVGRRAGLLPGAAAPATPPAPEDPRPALPEAASHRLTMLLPAPGSNSGAGSLANVNELLPQYLAAANAHGYRVPAPLAPPLLDAARARSELRGDAVQLAGPLGRWLAERNPDWRYVLRTPVRGGSDDDAEDGRRLWQEGLFAERVTHLTRLRRRDPAGARELLAASWSTERAEDRLLFLDALQENLSSADEPFLESALSDRSKNVRLTAAELLSTLPGSALARRMAERARAVVSLAPSTAGPRIVVHPPTGCDAAMQRDGIPATSPTGRSERAFWLGEIIAATPLGIWAEDLGAPAEVLALPVSEEWAQDLHDAWARAAVRQNDAAWARALLAGIDPGAGTAAKLLAVLPPAERARWTADFLGGSQGLGDVFQLLVACPAPWPRPLADAVLRSLARVATGGGYPWSHSGVLGVAERALPPAAADHLDALAADADSAWAEMFTRLAATLRLRATMLSELDP